MSERKSCECRWCDLSERIKAVKASGDAAQMAAMIDELAENYSNESFEHDYDAAILDGSWPTSVEQLSRFLGNAVKIRREQIMANRHALRRHQGLDKPGPEGAGL